MITMAEWKTTMEEAKYHWESGGHGGEEPSFKYWGCLGNHADKAADGRTVKCSTIDV